MKEIHDRTIASILAGDAAWFEELLHPDYIATSGDGKTMNRDDFFRTFSPPPASMQPQFEISEVEIIPHGDTVVVSARRQFRGVVNGREISNVERTTQIFRRSGTGLQLIAEHSSKPRE